MGLGGLPGCAFCTQLLLEWLVHRFEWFVFEWFVFEWFVHFLGVVLVG